MLMEFVGFFSFGFFLCFLHGIGTCAVSGAMDSGANSCVIFGNFSASGFR